MTATQGHNGQYEMWKLYVATRTGPGASREACASRKARLRRRRLLNGIRIRGAASGRRGWRRCRVSLDQLAARGAVADGGWLDYIFGEAHVAVAE